jgi:hypothetical protein
MKIIPKKTIPEIAKEFLDRTELTIDHVRKNKDEESTWVIHMSSVEADRAGWGKPAIARYFNREHSVINFYLNREKNAIKGSSDKQTPGNNGTGKERGDTVP